jgi:altronate hydrolase
VPTVKISTNTPLARRKPGWIDFDAGPIVNGQPLLEAAQALYQTVMQTANGCLTQNERSGFREIGIFKNGVTL